MGTSAPKQASPASSPAPASAAAARFEDLRPEATQHRALQAMMGNSPQAQKTAQRQAMLNSCHASAAARPRGKPQLQAKGAPAASAAQLTKAEAAPVIASMGFTDENFWQWASDDQMQTIKDAWQKPPALTDFYQQRADYILNAKEGESALKYRQIKDARARALVADGGAEGHDVFYTWHEQLGEFLSASDRRTQHRAAEEQKRVKEEKIAHAIENRKAVGIKTLEGPIYYENQGFHWKVDFELGDVPESVGERVIQEIQVDDNGEKEVFYETFSRGYADTYSIKYKPMERGSISVIGAAQYYSYADLSEFGGEKQSKVSGCALSTTEKPAYWREGRTTPHNIEVKWGDEKAPTLSTTPAESWTTEPLKKDDPDAAEE